MKRLAIFLTLLLPLTSAAQGVLLDDIAELEPPELPELRQYSVEVIVFAYAEDVHTGTEIFVPELLPEPELLLDENGLPIIELLDEHAETAATDEAEVPAEALPVEELPADAALLDEPAVEEPVTFTFELMLEEDYALLDVLAELDELDAYEPLMHFGWVQGMLPDAETEELALETFAEPPSGLQGALTLYLSRYLHLVVDLELAADRDAFAESEDEMAETADDPYFRGPDPFEEPEPVPTYTDRRVFGLWEETPTEEEPRYAPLMYQISENRIVRNGEVRYYDHPKFGVIARVVRIEAEEEPEDVEENGSLPASPVAQ